MSLGVLLRSVRAADFRVLLLYVMEEDIFVYCVVQIEVVV